MKNLFAMVAAVALSLVSLTAATFDIDGTSAAAMDARTAATLAA